jgi:hypothetical protein
MQFEFKQFPIKCVAMSDNAENLEFSNEFDKVKEYDDLAYLLEDLKIAHIIPSNRVGVNLFITDDFFLVVELKLDEIYTFTYKIKSNEIGFFNL